MSEKRYPRRWKFHSSGAVLCVDQPEGNARWEDGCAMDYPLTEATIEHDAESDASFAEVFDHHDEPATSPDRAAIERLRGAAEGIVAELRSQAGLSSHTAREGMLRDVMKGMADELAAALAAMPKGGA